MNNEKEIQSKIDDALLRKRKGWTFGFDKLDDLAGRMEKGQVITLGGMTGTGKSYFVLNMIDGIRNEWVENTDEEFEPPKICLLYTSDAADDLLCVDLGGRRIIKKKKIIKKIEEWLSNRTSNNIKHLTV